MQKKLLGLMTLALVAVAATPALAQAAPAIWLSNGKPIPAYTTVPVVTSGKLTFTLRAPTGAPISTIKCRVTDLEEIFNIGEGRAEVGRDEMTEFGLVGCKAKPPVCPRGTVTEIVARELPWTSTLLAGPPIRDEIAGVKLQLSCSGAVIGTFTGNLLPEVGKSVLVFGAGSGALSEPTSGEILEVAGKDKLVGPPGDKKITAAV